MEDESLDQVLNGDPQPEEPAGETESATPAPETPETVDPPKEGWTKTAYLDEKRKRHELERELQALKTPEPKDPDVWEDPEHHFNKMRQEFKQEITNTRITMSQDVMRSLHDDYDQLEAEFVELKDPVLFAQMNASPNPAKFVYETMKQRQDLASSGEKDKRIAELEAQIAQMQGKPKEDIPPSLSSTRNVSGGNNDVINDDDLEELFGR